MEIISRSVGGRELNRLQASYESKKQFSWCVRLFWEELVRGSKKEMNHIIKVWLINTCACFATLFFSPLRTLYSPCVLSGWDVMGYWKKLRMAGETSGSFSSMNLRFFFSHNLQTTCYMVLEFKGKYFNDRKELYKSTQPLKNNPWGTELYMPQTHHECANTSFHILVKKETHLIMSNCKVKLCVILRIYTFF